MCRILVITGILPVSSIRKKKFENDIILEYDNYLSKFFSDIRFEYLFTLPYTNFIISLFSSVWSSYFDLQKSQQFLLRGKIIRVLGVIMLPKKLFFRNILYQLSFFLNRKKIDNIVCNFKPTIIHAQNNENDAYLAKLISKKYNIPYIVTLRGVYLDQLQLSTLNSAYKLIALNPIQKIRVGKFTTQEILFIPHGISDRFLLSEKHNLFDYNVIKIVTVCRLVKLKNIELVINSLKNFQGRFIFHIYGNGPEMEKLILITKKLKLSKFICFKGYVSNFKLPTILPKYDLFILPSFPETLGRSYFEAMACGLPVIASKGTGIDGIIEEGREGFLVDLSKSNSLGLIFELIFFNPNILLKMGVQAKQLSFKFNWDSIAKKLYDIYAQK